MLINRAQLGDEGEGDLLLVDVEQPDMINTSPKRLVASDAEKETPTNNLSDFKKFLGLYVVFIFPCLLSLFDELLHPPLIPSAVIPMTPSAVGLLSFMLTVFTLYAALRLTIGFLAW